MPDATTKAPEPAASDAAPAPPINFETLFEDICRKLPEDLALHLEHLGDRLHGARKVDCARDARATQFC